MTSVTTTQLGLIQLLCGNPDAKEVVSPLLHKYEYGGVPLLTDGIAEVLLVNYTTKSSLTFKRTKGAIFDEVQIPGALTSSNTVFVSAGLEDLCKKTTSE